RRVLCWPAFPLVSVLRSTGSAAAGSDCSAVGRAILFAGFTATTAESDFSCPSVIGYDSLPSRRGPGRHIACDQRRELPGFGLDPCARDVALDPGRTTMPRIAASLPDMSPLIARILPA